MARSHPSLVYDFAGSTVVHSVGAWTAFAAILLIGPRLGRFSPQPRTIEGHSLPTAVLGVFLLWFRWFGFNGGSTLGFTDQVPKILVNTAEGGAAGGLAALLTTWILDKRPKVPLIMNGVIGGLVSVTAGCNLMDPLGAIWTGTIGGLLCTLSVYVLNTYQIDDAVGVVPAHLVCGIWGTLAVALLSNPSLWASGYSLWQKLGIQSLGVISVGLYAFWVSYILLWAINRIYPLRVSPEQERIGLNSSEHGASTAAQDLITSMNTHSLRGDFTQPVFVEPETDVTPIADHYNRVLEKMNQIKADLNASQDRLLMILNSPAFPVVISDSDTGIIQFINQRAAERFGFTLQETGRYREMDFWPNRSDREVFLRQVRQQQRVANFEACLRKVNGSVFWSLISGLEILYNQCSCVLFSFSDISTQIHRESILRFLASTDPLTGISNRRAFFEQGENLLMSSSQGIWPLSILMLDIDHFKQVNDRWGHAKGDQVIQYLANSSSSILRDRDLVGRLGGEEFAILLVSTPVTVAQSIAERLREQIEQTPALAQSDPISITISVGLATIQPGDTLGSALQRADAALYQAKLKGRNRVEIYPRDP